VRTLRVAVFASTTRRPSPGEQQAEAELVLRLAAGDRGEPLEALYDAYGSGVFRLGLMLLRDTGLAEDLVQETFVRLWRSAPRYDPSRSSVRTFVFTLARRAAVDLWRRQRGPLPSALEDTDFVDVAGSEEFEHLLLRLDVRDALDALSPAHREVLELQYDTDLTQEQVAIRLGIPLGTVKSRTLYALRALARELGERGLSG
jgi:RNA polymerase sigma-70 factor (ECF subfamily)